MQKAHDILPTPPTGGLCPQLYVNTALCEARSLPSRLCALLIRAAWRGVHREARPWSSVCLASHNTPLRVSLTSQRRCPLGLCLDVVCLYIRSAFPYGALGAGISLLVLVALTGTSLRTTARKGWLYTTQISAYLYSRCLLLNIARHRCNILHLSIQSSAYFGPFFLSAVDAKRTRV